MAAVPIYSSAVLALATQRGASCDAGALPPVFFLLTSTPDRALRVPRVLDTLRKQTLRPQHVVLTVARQYNGSRFANTTFPLSALQNSMHPRAVPSPSPSISTSSWPWLIVHHIDIDRGPMSKYFGAHHAAVRQARTHGAIVVVGDDDVYYGRTFVEDYACAVASVASGTVFSSGIDFDCGSLRTCVMGFRGVGMRARMLDDVAAMPVPGECFLADDVAITHYLTRLHAYRIKRLRLRTKYKIDNEYAWSNSSINTYHRERKFGVNKKCVAALLRSMHEEEVAINSERRRRYINM